MNSFDQFEVWFVTGAQLLYGGDAVIAVDAHSNEMVAGLNASGNLPVKVVYKGTVNSAKEVTAAFKAANNDDKCIGVITWMHTFSPAKMWIHGLQELKKPLLHFHTQHMVLSSLKSSLNIGYDPLCYIPSYLTHLKENITNYNHNNHIVQKDVQVHGYMYVDLIYHYSH